MNAFASESANPALKPSRACKAHRRLVSQAYRLGHAFAADVRILMKSPISLRDQRRLRHLVQHVADLLESEKAPEIPDN